MIGCFSSSKGVNRMTLRKYLMKFGIKQNKFAGLIGYSEAHISRIINKQRVGSRMCALKIEKATDGIVSRNEILYPR
jgi:DNA-binding transcriptional regulator YdaS (Cro superfamily)